LNVFALLPGFRNRKPPSRARNLPARASAKLQLAPINLRPSIILWRVQWGVHLLLSLLLGWGILPWLSIQPYWLPVLLLAWLALAVHLRYLRRLHEQSAGTLLVSSGDWYWNDARGCTELVLSGAVIVWPQLIVLPFREQHRRWRKTLVLLPDSASADDRRRLRVWLRTSLNH
jgi:hypothetical protein